MGSRQHVSRGDDSRSNLYWPPATLLGSDYFHLKHAPHPDFGLQAAQEGTFAETQKACGPLRDPNSKNLCSTGSGPMKHQGCTRTHCLKESKIEEGREVSCGHGISVGGARVHPGT